MYLSKRWQLTLVVAWAPSLSPALVPAAKQRVREARPDARPSLNALQGAFEAANLGDGGHLR